LIELPEVFDLNGLLLMQTLLRKDTEKAEADFSKIMDHAYFKADSGD
jgi:hypothetical protein